ERAVVPPVEALLGPHLVLVVGRVEAAAGRLARARRIAGEVAARLGHHEHVALGVAERDLVMGEQAAALRNLLALEWIEDLVREELLGRLHLRAGLPIVRGVPTPLVPGTDAERVEVGVCCTRGEKRRCDADGDSGKSDDSLHGSYPLRSLNDTGSNGRVAK